MRVALALLLFGVLCLSANSILWLREPAAASARLDPAHALAAFERTHASTPIAIDRLYGDRLELLDPKLALPTWHRHEYEEAVRVHAALATCPPAPTSPIADPILAKAYEWHRRTCAGGRFDEAVERPPFSHPSGHSYAALALARGAHPPEWITAHANAFHVSELAALDPKALPADYRALARISFPAWVALARGDLVMLDHASFVVSEPGALGLGTVRVHRADEWKEFARRWSIDLGVRTANAICDRPASPDFCWVAVPASERHRGLLVASTVFSLLLLVGSAATISVLWLRERARARTDRIEILRLLTHELRTPATSLRLDIEPMRAAYDDLPPDVQEPFLRVSDAVERLHRVIHRSARYLALFETPSAARDRLLRVEEHDSIGDLLAGLAEEWPEGASVELVARSPDRAIRTDADWLGLILRNLVENAVRHGHPPIVVSWATDAGELVLRIADGGSMPGFSLRDVAPFRRHERSNGLGLGLSLVLRGTEVLGGRLAHEASPTVFELRLPLAGAA
jgi:signal transduction histidine kinase